MRFAIRMTGGGTSETLLPAMVLVFGCISGAIAQDRIREFRYAITQVPGVGGDLEFAFGMNDHGHIVGEALTPDKTETRPIFWNGRVTRDLGTFGGTVGRGYDVNNDDWVVGSARYSGSTRNHAYLWKGKGDKIALPELEFAKGSAAYAINESRIIVGSSDTPQSTIAHAVLWEDESTIHDLGTLGGPELDSSAYAINNHGYVTGWSGINKGGSYAFLWHGQKMVHLGSLGDGMQRAEPHGMNDIGTIVETGSVNTNNTYRPFVYKNGRWRNLLRPVTDHGFNWGTAYDVNNADQIVGEFHHERLDRYFGFIWEEQNGLQWLNDLLPPQSPWHIWGGYAINEHGQIAANADPNPNPDAVSRILLLTPVKPELTLQLPDGPLQADAINTLTITNAQPGATIKFFYGKRGGGKRIPGCDALAAMTQIDDPVAFGEAIADANGNAELEIYIPPRGAVHWGFLIQAVDFQNCEESQLVLKKVE